MSEEQKLKNQKYLEYLNKHAARMKMWCDAHGTRRLPPTYEDSEGKLHWVNRETRRKMERK